MNPRITPVTGDDVPTASRPVLQAIEKSLGMVPNLHQTLARSPAALGGYVATVGALSKGVLSPALREQVAVAAAAVNGCGYCASAHTMLGKAAGVDADELARNLDGDASDGRTGAALAFVRKLIESRGALPDGELEKLRSAGFGEDEIVEIIAHVGLNWFTNVFNVFARTDIDFPVVELPQTVKGGA